jgi:alpha/beta superfamily hydrolase
MANKPPRSERIVLPGPAGDLQALIETPEQLDSSHFGVVCHPHPLFGGTLDNKVVYTLARAFEELGAPTIRFNFRGVGTSAGTYDEGVGETEDALAAIAYGRERWPGAVLWLAGFSFGGAVAIRAADRAQPERLVAIAPAVTRLNVGDAVKASSSWLIVQGDADEVIDSSVVLDWASKLSPTPAINAMPGASHFFHGRLHELREIVLGFMRESASTYPTPSGDALSLKR